MFFLEKTSRFRDETILQIVRDLFEEKIADYKNAPKSVQNIKIDHPDYPADKLSPSKFKANMQMHGFQLQEIMKTYSPESAFR